MGSELYDGNHYTPQKIMKRQMGSGRPSQQSPSFNMMFAYFKQQGYSDHLAAVEARRMTAMAAFAPTNTQMTAYQYKPQTMLSTRQPIVHGKTRSKEAGLTKPAADTASTSFTIPISTESIKIPKNKGKTTIPLVLKVSKRGEEQKVHISGCLGQKEQETDPSNYKATQGAQSMSKDYWQDIKGGINIHKNAGQAEKLTMVEINKWIQDLYAHYLVGTRFKSIRQKISDYVEKVVCKYRQGCLSKRDLYIPTEAEMMGKISRSATDNVAGCYNNVANVSNIDDTSKMAEAKVSHKSSVQGAAGTNKTMELEGPSNRNNYISDDEEYKKQKRLQRFKSSSASYTVNKIKPTKGKRIVGTSEDLEKPYLRLTAEPNPASVRPERVLMTSFRHVFDKFLSSRDYRYIEEQFRSIRQDIQVQHLKSPFVIKLYATNARLALVHGDLDQFNQCQTQLLQLSRHVGGFPIYKREFDLYCLLYLAMQNMKMDLLRYLRDAMGSDFMGSPHYRYAMAIRSALAEGNFVNYFRMADTSDIDHNTCISEIYQEAFSTLDFSDKRDAHNTDVLGGTDDIQEPPFYSKLLFRMFEPRFRMNALVNMTSTAVSLSMETIAEVLNFRSTNDCIAFIRENRGVICPNGLLDCKNSIQAFMSSPLLRNKKL